jgi:hypothetical protein
LLEALLIEQANGWAPIANDEVFEDVLIENVLRLRLADKSVASS